VLEIGRIVRAHGLRGEVIVDLLTNRDERLAPGTVLHAPPGDLEVEAARPHQGRWIVQFAGVNGRSAAEALRGVRLSAPPLDEPDTIWVHELVGRVARDPTGRFLGWVVAVEANPASDLAVLDDGGLVPLRFVVETGAGGIVVDPPAGLLEPLDDPVRLVASEPAWSEQATAEAARIDRTLGESDSGIEHIGSTAVPGLEARPIVDLLVTRRGRDGIEEIQRPLARLGYQHLPGVEYGPDHELFVAPAARPRRFHVHVCVAGSDSERRHLAFRDRLRADAELRREYDEVRRHLAAEHADDPPAYEAGKAAFIAARQER
jgi:16S rRNA processing protein RimM